MLWLELGLQLVSRFMGLGLLVKLGLAILALLVTPGLCSLMVEQITNITTNPFNYELLQCSCTEMRNKHAYTLWAIKKEPTYFFL